MTSKHAIFRQGTEAKRLAAVRDKFRVQVLEGETHYEVLGVPPAASLEMIKGTHRQLASVFHPDRCQLPDAQALMAKINVAYCCLTDKEQRRKYDAVNKTAQDACTTCDGKGTVLKQKGFKAKITVPCPACGGSGCQ